MTALRMAVVLATWPIVYLADRLRGVDPPASLRVGLGWARGELRYGRLVTAAADPMSGELQTTISGLARRQAKAVDEKLRALLAARGIDPDDRSDGWEDRAREALADLEIVDSVDMSDPYRMTVTIEIRPKRASVGEEEQ